MNHYTQILNYIKELAESDPLVNKVTQDDVDKVDLNKMSMLPLVHIALNNGSFSNGSTVNLTIELAALSIVVNTNEQTTDPFFLNTNEVDVYGETLAILNRIFSRMTADLSKSKIRTTQNPSYRKIESIGQNNLTGWLLTIDVEMPNNEMNLCQYPIA